MAGLYLTGFGVFLMVTGWGLHKLNTRWYLQRLARATRDGQPEPSAGLYQLIDFVLVVFGRLFGLFFVVLGMWLFTGSLD